MAVKSHVAMIKRGVAEWNAWRAGSHIKPDLSGANLSNLNLRAGNLRNIEASGANFRRADLSLCQFGGANVNGANFAEANLSSTRLYNLKMNKVNFTRTNLIGAETFYSSFQHSNFKNAHLETTVFHTSDLSNARFEGATLSSTVFANCKLSYAKGLGACEHKAHSSIDFSTLQISGSLPARFLRGVGLPKRLIENLPLIMSVRTDHYSCFISYSVKDQTFASRLHADLQDRGVQCWFSPHDMPVGGKLLDEIDVGIRRSDKLLLILSKQSIGSEWVEDEVTTAFEEERNRGEIVLFPIRIDDVIMKTKEPWAAKLRSRLIGDFRRWKEPASYDEELGRLVHDLLIPTEKDLSTVQTESTQRSMEQTFGPVLALIGFKRAVAPS